jgi:prevent-host-death family protein
MKMNATEFKAKCLAVIDRVHERHESVTITKHGKVVAKLVPEIDTSDKPWLRLRSTRVRWQGDPFKPVVTERDIKALK